MLKFRFNPNWIQIFKGGEERRLREHIFDGFR